MAPAGATVQESAMIPERTSGTLREIDILIKHSIAGIALHIAVECRDRARKGDVEWIDALIGKYRDLGIDKVIAVSREGFTSAALKKAQANNIETRTLEKALRTNWPNQFYRLVLANFIRYTRISEVSIETDSFTINGVVRDDPSGKIPVFNSTGEVCGQLSDFIDDCYNKIIEQHLTELINEHGLEIGKLVQERDTLFLFGMKILINNLFMRQSEDLQVLHPIHSFVIQTESKFEFQHMPLNDYIYQDVQVSTGQTELLGLDAKIEVIAIQQEGKEDIHVSFKPAS